MGTLPGPHVPQWAHPGLPLNGPRMRLPSPKGWVISLQGGLMASPVCYPNMTNSAAYSYGRSSGLKAQAPSNGKRSEEHTSELQSLTNLVCRLLLEKKKKKK